MRRNENRFNFIELHGYTKENLNRHFYKLVK
jgi:hypothetical protein